MTPLFALLGAACLVNLAVSVLVIRSRLYSPVQKLLQCLLLWLIPILGPVGIWAFLRAQHRWEKYDTRAFPEPSEKMVVVEINDAINGNAGGGVDGGGD